MESKAGFFVFRGSGEFASSNCRPMLLRLKQEMQRLLQAEKVDRRSMIDLGKLQQPNPPVN